MWSKMIPRKVGVELKRRRELNKRRLGLEVSLLEIHREEIGLKFARVERKIPILIPAI